MFKPNPAWIRVTAFLAAAFMLAAVFTLPITSMPSISHIMGGTLVAPPSVVLIGFAALLYLPVMLAKKFTLPAALIPLLVFCFVAWISSLLSFFLPVPAYKNLSLFREVIQAVLTLLIGLVCFTMFSIWARSRPRLEWVFRLINISGVIVILWSALQVYFMYFRSGQYPAFILKIHDLLSVQSLLTFWYMRRAVGFALEPSWLAHQFNILYLPYWIGSTLTGYSAFRIRVVRISLENLLLVLGVLVMFSSLSRIGYLTLMLVAAYLFYRLNFVLSKWAALRINKKRNPGISSPAKIDRRLQAGIGIGLLGGFLVLGGASVLLLSFLDPRIAALLSQNYQNADFFYVANNLTLAERFAYWGLGWNVFTLRPFLGVGLGNIGFFFESQLPRFGWALNEMLKIYYETAISVNCKNLWLRLLAETGIVGFSFFISWLTVIFYSAGSLRAHKEPLLRTLGWMGLLAVVALVGEGFSVDTFALPYYWAAFGLVAAGRYLAAGRLNPDSQHTSGIFHE